MPAVADRRHRFILEIDCHYVRTARPDTPVWTIGQRRRNACFPVVERLDTFGEPDAVEVPSCAPQPFNQQARGRQQQVGWNDRMESDKRRALELDPGLSRAYIALARINQYRWNGTEARQAYEEGLRLAPNDVDLLRGYAWFNSIARNHEYAIELAERAVDIDPMNAAAHAELGQRLTFAGHWDAAYVAHQAAAFLAPDYGVYRLRVANNQVARGNLPDALSELRTAEALSDLTAASPDLLAELAYAYSRAGSAEDARRIVDIIDTESSNTHVGVGARAMSLLALGQHSQALDLLRESAVEVVNRGIIDGGFKSLAQISANVLADPELEQPAFQDARSKLTFNE